MPEDNVDTNGMQEINSDQEEQTDQDQNLAPTNQADDQAEDGEVLDPEETTEVPREIVRQVEAFGAMFQSQQVRPYMNPLFEKFTDEHIDKYLDYIQRDDDHEHQLRKSNRWFYLGYFMIAIFALGLAVWFLLPRDKDFLESLIQIIVLIAGGIGAGYGYSEARKK
jgi:hypothetical protein